MSLSATHRLATPPPAGWERDLWLFHVAGFIVMHDVRRRTQVELSEEISSVEQRVAERAIDATIANFLTIADQVIGRMENDEFAVSLRLAVQLEDQSSGETLQHLDLFESDGACGPLNDWINGDFGTHPVAHTRPG